jgi:CheY-like chemotaxis protein
MNPQSVTDAKILIVDDDQINVRFLGKILTGAGYQNVSGTTDSREVASILSNCYPDLLLLDLHMPHVDGYQILERIPQLLSAETFLPVIILTADVTPEAKQRTFGKGATDFLIKPFEESEVLLRVKNALRMRFLHRQLQDQNVILEQRVADRTMRLERSLAELRRTQQQLLQQERLRALGVMATGIAHDVNNVLALILGYSELLLGETSATNGSKPGKYLQIVVNAAHDAARIVNRLAHFYRPSSERDLHESVQISGVIEQAITLTRPRWQDQAMADGIDIEIKLSVQGEPEVTGDPSELRELLTSLIFNAVEAMAGGGTIWIRAWSDAEVMVLEVEDAGTGMSEEVRARCLEPFFTTRGEKAAGLGLALVSGIVQRHQGTLEIQTELGFGTKFAVRLPVKSTVLSPVSGNGERPGHSLRILAVDDQPMLTEMLAEYLQVDFHQVFTASSGDAALKRLHEVPDFDLIITDKAMPGMNGLQFAAAVRQVRPEVPIMLLTGFGEEGTDTQSAREVDLVLGKPVDQKTLRKAIGDVMSRASRTREVELVGSLKQ